MPSILFVCTANQFRSPIAAACLLKSIERENTNAKWIVESAGTWTTSGLPAPKMALEVANQLRLKGLDYHRTRQVDQNILDRFDLILVMEVGHKEAISIEFPSTHGRLYTLSEIVDDISYDIPDPANLEINPADVGRQLSMLITRGKGRILQMAESLSRLRSQQ
jgi:protein-tyrosine phosphatase